MIIKLVNSNKKLKHTKEQIISAWESAYKGDEYTTDEDYYYITYELENVECEHHFKRLHWVDGVVFCNKCKKTLHK